MCYLFCYWTECATKALHILKPVDFMSLTCVHAELSLYTLPLKACCHCWVTHKRCACLQMSVIMLCSWQLGFGIFPILNPEITFSIANGSWSPYVVSGLKLVNIKNTSWQDGLQIRGVINRACLFAAPRGWCWYCTQTAGGVFKSEPVVPKLFRYNAPFV